ncbi:MAG: hypothetical protein AAB341_01385 [Planctomycetota bacterium]
MRRNRTFWIIVVVAWCVLYLTVIAPAFWSFVIVGTSGRFDYHSEITKDAIGSAFVDGATLRGLFQANGESDMGQNLNNHALHFDSEVFQAGTQLLADNLNEAVASLAACEKDQAIRRLGAAFHAVQDFYAHSNWVENHLTSPTLVPGTIPICLSLVTLDVNGIFVPGPLAPDPSFNDTCTQAPGPSNPNGPLASGYYPEGPGQIPSNKCSHHATNKDSAAFNDLAVPDENESPRGAYEHNQLPLHLFAKYVAKAHTRELWDGPVTGQGFKQALNLRFGEVNGPTYYNLLTKAQRNIAFVIDISGSMAGELPMVKAKIATWIDSLPSAESAPRLTLVTFDDVVFPVRTSCSPSEFLSWINALSAVGGGDCPESSITAMTRAAEIIGDGGTIILATDAPPKEGAAEKEALKKQKVTIHTIWDWTCELPPFAAQEQGGVAAASEPSLGIGVYPEIAAATGGMSLRFDSTNLVGFEKAFDAALDATTPRLYDIAIVEATVTFGETDVIAVPVDTTVERLDLILTFSSSHGLTVRRPKGVAVSVNDPDATFVNSANFKKVRITAPGIGTWTMEVTGTGSYQASAKAVSDIAVFDMTFLNIYDCGDGVTRIDDLGTSLHPGHNVHFEAVLLGELGVVSLDLVHPDGSILQQLDATEDELGLGTWGGEYTPTSLIDRFYVRAYGTDGSGAQFQRILRRPFSVDPTTTVSLVEKLTADDPGDTDRFGRHVATDGDVAIVGAYLDDCGSGVECGAAYVYRFNGSTWVQDAKLTASDAAAGDKFGLSVSVSGDTAIVGAVWDDCAAGAYCGSAYVYRFNGGIWVQEAKLTASDATASDWFGYSSSVSGNTAVVGAIWADCVVGGQNCGAAYVYRFNGSAWVPEAKLTASDAADTDGFGISVSVSGVTVVVGAFNEDCAAGADCGAAYVYRFNGSAWVQDAKLTASDAAAGDKFGLSVSVSGDTAIVGALNDDCAAGSDCGAAYVYRFNGSTWVEERKLTASDAATGDKFGVSVSLSGDTAVVGAYFDDCAAGTDCGSAYIFEFQTPTDDCNDNGVPDQCDIASGASSDCNGNAIPDECDAIAPLSDVVNPDKSRFVSFFVPSWPSGCGSAPETALRVKLTTVHNVVPPYTAGASIPFTLFEGQSQYVGPPVQYVESVSSGTTFMASTLQCTPYYQDWSTIPLLHVTGEAILPSSSFDVENLAFACQGQETSAPCLSGGANVSTPLAMATGRWGDVVTTFQLPTPPVTQPDFGDIGALINKFKSAPGAPIKARAMLAGYGLRGLINITPDLGFGHISACIDAFKGLAYPYKPGKCTGAQTTACITDVDCGANGPCILCP